MKNIASNINKILQNISVINKDEYSVLKMEIESKSFTDCQTAFNYFSEIPNASGWFCDTSTSGFNSFSNNQNINKEKIGWILEGEAVSEDKKTSSRISQNQEGGWLVQLFKESEDEKSPEYLVRNQALRKVKGGKMTYQIAYSLDKEKNKLFPAWQRFIGFSGNN